MRNVLSLVFLTALTGAAAAAGEDPSLVDQAMVSGLTPPVEWLAVLPILIPLLGAAVAVTFRSSVNAQSVIALVTMGLATLAAVALNGVVAANGPLVMAMGNWLPPFGIVIAVDSLGALFVLLTCIVGLVALGYARQDVDRDSVKAGFFALYLAMMAGVAGAFSTGDLFNLYVWFEVFLISSFGLIVLGSKPLQLDGAVRYGVLNLIATTIFLISVGGLYGLTGSLNMADIRTILETQPAGPVSTLAALFVLAFAMKAAAFPLHFWLPASYHTPKTIVSALFAGLLTKVGVYSLMRVQLMVFGADGEDYLGLVLAFGAVTAVLGALGAMAQTDMKRMAAFLVVSGIGSMFIGFGLGTTSGLAAAIVYAVHSILTMTALFLIFGLVDRLGGANTLAAGSGIYSRHGLVAALFLIVALAVAGLPPFSGFWPKFMLIDAAIDHGGTLATVSIVAVIVTGIITTMALGRGWILVILRPQENTNASTAALGMVGREGMLSTLVLFAALILGLGLFPSLVVEPARMGAEGLLDPSVYVERVLGVQ